MSHLTRKKIRRQREALAERFDWRLLVGVILSLALVALLMGALYSRTRSPRGPFRATYDGLIVDKWADYSESQLGSRPFFRLSVESDDHLRFTVSVSNEIYDRARVGMRVKKDDKGIELIADNQKNISFSADKN